MQDHIFRTYDIRGKVGLELSVDHVAQLAHAIAHYYRQQDQSVQTVSVGMDGRTHSLAIKEQLVKGLQESGLDVVFIGVCPSPVLYFSQYWLDVQAAVMITASHNPHEYNGFKICLNKKSVSGVQIQKILKLFKQKVNAKCDKIGDYREHMLVPEYVQFLKQLFPDLVGADVNTVFDTGNGAVGAVLPELVEAMQWKRATLQCIEVDSLQATHEADPTHDNNVLDLKETVLKKHAALGIGFDGDGDRMGAVTGGGRLISGDTLLTLYSEPILQVTKGATVACDIKCSNIVKEMIQKWGGKTQVSPSGHSFIKECMEEHNALIAGELSCHFFFKDRYFGFDDGVYAALRLFELLLQSGTSLEALLAKLPTRKISPELRIDCNQAEGSQIVERLKTYFSLKPNVEITTIDGVRVDTQNSWGLVRASNTQPVICMRFESSTREGLQEIRDAFVEAIGSEEMGKKITWPEI
jgi:phosphomannomutase/phosphoglucomutase